MRQGERMALKPGMQGADKAGIAQVAIGNPKNALLKSQMSQVILARGVSAVLPPRPTIVRVPLLQQPKLDLTPY